MSWEAWGRRITWISFYVKPATELGLLVAILGYELALNATALERILATPILTTTKSNAQQAAD